MSDRHWKTEPLAEQLGISPDTLRRAAHRGELRPVVVRGELRWPEEEAFEWARTSHSARKTRIYFVQEGEGGPVKIGNSTWPERRLQDHQCGNPRTLYLLGSFAATRSTEREIHERFAEQRLTGEWFQPTTELLEYVLGVCG